jgi:hypothetical protein
VKSGGSGDSSGQQVFLVGRLICNCRVVSEIKVLRPNAETPPEYPDSRHAR